MQLGCNCDSGNTEDHPELRRLLAEKRIHLTQRANFFVGRIRSAATVRVDIRLAESYFREKAFRAQSLPDVRQEPIIAKPAEVALRSPILKHVANCGCSDGCAHCNCRLEERGMKAQYLAAIGAGAFRKQYDWDVRRKPVAHLVR